MLSTSYLAIAIVAAVPYIGHAAPPPDMNIYGKWHVVSVLDSAEIIGASTRQARTYVGKIAYIDATSFRFQNTRCKRPSFARTEQETAHYLRESWHARSGNLGLPDRVTVIDARCTDIFIKGNDAIVFNWKGYFLEAKKLASRQQP